MQRSDVGAQWESRNITGEPGPSAPAEAEHGASPASPKGEAPAPELGIPAATLQQRVTGELERARKKLDQYRQQGWSLWNRARGRGGREAQRWLGKASTLPGANPMGGLCGIAESWPLDAEHILLAYSQGLYALDFKGKLRWQCPPQRFVLYLSELRISSNMRRELRLGDQYDFSFDRCPEAVLAACADRSETWLSPRMQKVFMDLFEMGAMHSVEAWRGSELVGGSFGVSIGRVWTSESMFHRANHAGKAQRAHLLAHLKKQGYLCVDSQEYSPHVARFGARDIPFAEYQAVLARGLAKPARFYDEGEAPDKSASAGKDK